MPQGPVETTSGDIPQLPSLSLRVEGEIGYLGLNRPDTLNAFDMAMIEDITAAAEWFDARRDVKVVLVYSTGRAFSSGFHLDQFRNADAEAVARNIDTGRRMIDTLERMRHLTVCAANGHCIGGGLILLLAGDFRYASHDLSCLLPETHLGIPLPWGGVPRLVREVGSARAAEIVLLGERSAAAALKDFGILNDVVEPQALLEHADGVAKQLCQLSRFVLETTKAQLRAAKEHMASTDLSVPEENAVRIGMADPESVVVRRRRLGPPSC
jgi:enoyl-CoA hydratase/carnithine racemase